MLRLRCRSLFRHTRVEDELDAEFRFHLDEQIHDNIAAGMSLADARSAALRTLGAITQLKEECRDMRQLNLLEHLIQDCRYAVRQMRKNPGFTAVALLSLGLGIGATTAVFSIVNAYLLRSMPVDKPDRLVALYLTRHHSGGIQGISYPELLDYRRQETGLSDIMGSTGIALSVTDGEKPELIWGEIVTGNYFTGLGVRPILGRGFLPDEDRVPGQKPVCVINYHFWLKHYRADPGVIGSTIRINQHPFTIVGVAPHGFIGTTLFNFIPDVWIPVMMQRTIAPTEGNYLEGRDNRWLNARARLRPGVTQAQAEAALSVITTQMGTTYPRTDRDLMVHLAPAGARMQPYFAATGLVAKTTGLMAGVVLLVLLIACANVGNLMLARARSRTREIAIRIAIGAGRFRLMRQMLTESLVLSLFAGALGIGFGLLFNRMLMSFYPSLDFQTADLDYEMRLDPRLFPFTIVIAAVTTMIFGLLPALRASRIDQASAIKGGMPSADTARGWRLGRGNMLILAQVSVSVLLLIWGGLFLRSTLYSHNVDVGFDRGGILMFGVDLDLQGYTTSQGRIFQHALVDRLRGIPGVDNVSLAAPLPLDAYDRSIKVTPEGYIPRSNREENAAGFSAVASHYFETMGTRLVAGRGIDERDSASAPRVAVINETMARRYWQTPVAAIGRRFTAQSAGPPIEIVGVARNGKYNMIGEPETSYCFLPIDQEYQGRTTVLVRSKVAREVLMPEVRRSIGGLDANLPLFGIRTVPEFLNRILALYELGAALFGTFAAMALLLAAVGIFGVAYFIVVRRTKEIGIRMALGASHPQVLRLIIGRSMLFVAMGILIGAGLAVGASGMMGALVAGVSGDDPLSLGFAILLFMAVATLALLVPTRRAMRIEPVAALRVE
jgi:predicted permease